MRTVKGYGWRRDLPDHRDFKLTAPTLVQLPPKVDLRPQCPPVYDQGNIGSCTANAIGAAFEFQLLKDGMLDFTPSRLFIYYNERAMEGCVGDDSGAQIRDGMKSIATQGVCGELEWPYDVKKIYQKPPDTCYDFAKLNTAIEYLRVNQDINHLKACLCAGFPFVFGFSVFESFESPAVAKTGMVPLPGITEGSVGGHAVMCVGYDDSKDCFIVRNSWGPNWGLGGYFYLPYGYVVDQNLGSDFWTIRSVA